MRPRLLRTFTLLFALCAIPWPATAQVGGWELLNPPSPRAQHAAVWDSIGERMLLFGGVGGANLGDLWSYEPSSNQWAQLLPDGPRPPRLVGHSAVWDPGRERVLQYGGHGVGGGALWSFAPRSEQWERLEPPGRAPAARGYHSAVWDPAREWMIVYGGIGPRAEILDDLWAYDAREDAWIELPRPATRPTARFYQAAAWDPVGDQLLVFGGADLFRGVLFDDLWSYRPSTNRWTELAPPGPRPGERLSHTMVWDPVGSRVLMYGGGCGAGCYHDDLWSFDPGTLRWLPLLGVGAGLPGRRGGHSAVWDSTRGRLLIFGGSSVDGSSNELWSYLPRTGTWTRFAGGWDRTQGSGRDGVWWLAPLPRQGHSAAWDQGREELLIFGGYAGDRVFEDLWRYSPRSQSWRPVVVQGDRPSARSNAGSAWDAAQRQLYLFGGFGASGYLDELWRFDAETQTWEQLPAAGDMPVGREDASLVWDPLREMLLVYGGTRGDGGLDQLYAYQVETGTWIQLSSEAAPGRRYRHSAVWDPERERMLLFGGYGGAAVGDYLNDLWSYEPARRVWEPLAVGQAAPAPRAWHRATWDPVGGRLLVMGGFAGGVDYLDDLWTYEPSVGGWSEVHLTEPVPTARAQHSLVWTDGGILVYGGSGGGLHGELWRLRPSAAE